MTYASVNALQLYFEVHGSGRPLVLLHGGLMTIDLNFGPLIEPLAASRQVVALELQGHGHTADTDRPMTIEALADDRMPTPADFQVMRDAYDAVAPDPAPRTSASPVEPTSSSR